jgi:hypothetical protein
MQKEAGSISSLAQLSLRDERYENAHERLAGWLRRPIVRYYCGRLVSQSDLMKFMVRLKACKDWPPPIAVWLGPKPDSSPVMTLIVHVEYDMESDVKQCDPVSVMRSLAIPAVRSCVLPSHWKRLIWSQGVCVICGAPSHNESRCAVKRASWLARRSKFMATCSAIDSINLSEVYKDIPK